MRETSTPAEDNAPAAPETTISLEALLDEDGGDASFRRFIDELLSVSVGLQAVRAALGKRIGLTGVQYSLLTAVLHLTRVGQAATVSRVAEHLHVSGTFVTAETRKLIPLGLIEKAANPVDGRSILLALTEAGDAKLREVRPTVRRLNDEIFRNLDRSAFETVAPWIADLAETVENALASATRLNRKRRGDSRQK